MHHARNQRTTVNDKATMKNKDTQRYYLNVENITRRLTHAFQEDEAISDFPNSILILYMAADVIQTDEPNSGFVSSNLLNFLNEENTFDVNDTDVDSKLPSIYAENMNLYKQKKRFVTDKILSSLFLTHKPLFLHFFIHLNL